MTDTTATGDVPATVSFQLTWTAGGRQRALGRPDSTAPTDAAAFRGRFFTRARATGTFAGAAGAFSFQSLARPRSAFAELGTEENGMFLGPACAACGAPPPPAAW